MDNQKTQNLTLQGEDGGPDVLKNVHSRETVYTKNNDLTNISSNTTEHQVSSAKKLIKSSVHIENSEQSSYIYLMTWIFFHKSLTLLVHVHLVKARIYHLLSNQLKRKN